MKSPGQEVHEEPTETQKNEEIEAKQVEEETVQQEDLEDDAEKEELRVYLSIVSEDEGFDVESLATKYPIVDWETQILANNKYYYQIKRADGSIKHYNLFSAMLYDFDRQDVLELYRLVKGRFQTESPEGYDLLLWGDLKTMMEPNGEDEIWRNQQDWNLIKKYPLSQDVLSMMLQRRIEVDHQSEMGYELIRWQKKMHFLLSSMSVVYVLTTPMIEDGGDNPTVEQVRKRAKWDNDDYVCRGLILNGSHLRIKESLKVQNSDKPKDNNVAGPLVFNRVEHNNSSWCNDNKGKHKHHDNTRADPNKKAKPTCWKCVKTGHIKRDYKAVNVGNKANGSGIKGSVDGSSNSLKDDDVAWWVVSRAMVHVCKDRCRFKSYESLNDGSILHMGNESTTLVHGRGCVDLRLGHVHFKRMQDMSKDGLIPTFDMDTKNDMCDLHVTPSLKNKRYFVTFVDDASRFCYFYLLYLKDEALDKFKVFKTEVELQQGPLIKRFRTDRGGLSQGFYGEAMLTACYLLIRVPNKRN
ncbi:zinc finger, CCHC-type containing protein, partial [Tanacetum coccineum]